LQDDKGAAKPRLAPQETQFLTCIKFAQHSAHRHSDGQPFADLQRPIDAHPNQEGQNSPSIVAVILSVMIEEDIPFSLLGG
jgi:hypothetical protein